MPKDLNHISFFKNDVLTISSIDHFSKAAKQIFEEQYRNNCLYKHFCDLIGKNPSTINNLHDIPYIPIEFFRSNKIITDSNHPSEVLSFISSGTTNNESSKHYISFPDIYIASFTEGFKIFYGTPKNYNIFALLPSYLEKGDSSLVFMVDNLIKQSGGDAGGFYMQNFKKLEYDLHAAVASGKKTMLIGVSYALLDFASVIKIKFPNIIVVETGGMKGKRKEIVKKEMHDILKSSIGVSEIHSEYGMTELCSQAWSKGNGIYHTPPWMRVKIREINDPKALAPIGKTGIIRIADLANISSCAFIDTQDLGRLNRNGSFEVLGRMDNSIMRGCNLIV